MKIFGLARYSYDWYEWENVEAVSFNRDALVALHAGSDEKPPLVSDDTPSHEWHGEHEVTHYHIIEIDFIGEL